MPFYYYHFDWTYLYLVVPCLLLSLFAQHLVNSNFRRYSQVMSSRRITGAEAVQIVLRYYGVQAVRVEPIGGHLTDHYDPRTNVVRLSQEVYHSTSVASIGVACHEAGHAVQYAKGYAPIKLRAAIIPITNIGSKMAMPLILMGLLFGFLGKFSGVLVDAGILCFSLSLIFQLVTLPVEFNASRRALQAIDQAQILTDEERAGARKTLVAAAMTYVAAVAVSLAQLLRIIILFGNRRDDD